jgi:two-component system response regulator AtoC
LQAKLLHVLQDQQFTRLGNNRPIDIDVRVIAASNQNLENMMRAGTFREDLYYRLQVIELSIPPLRDRREEIPALVEFFLGKYARTYRRPAVRQSPALKEAILNYQWPGNIRELENMMKRYVVLQDEQFILSELARLSQAEPHRAAALVAAPPAPSIRRSDPLPIAPPLPVSLPERDPDLAALEDIDPESGVDLQALIKAASLRVEREAIEQALSRFRWNRRRAATYLQVSYKTLLNKMKECGISDPAAS